MDEFSSKIKDFNMDSMTECLQSAEQMYVMNISSFQDLMQYCLNPINVSELDLNYDIEIDEDDKDDDEDFDSYDDKFNSPLDKPKAEFNPFTIKRPVNITEENGVEVVKYDLFPRGTERKR